MSVIWWALIGIGVGSLGKVLIMNRHHRGDLMIMILIAIVGAFLGGFFGNLVTGSTLNTLSFRSAGLALVGAVVLVWIYVVSISTKSSGSK